jgi:hypothetical protein
MFHDLFHAGMSAARPAVRIRLPGTKNPQARTGDLGPERESRLGESNPRPTHYECVALTD